MFARRLFAAVFLCTAFFAMAAAGVAAEGDSGAGELTGLGATKKAWKRAHKADPNPKLHKGCCFVPKVRDADGILQDTWAAVSYGDPPEKRVLGYYRNFPRGTNEATALALLIADDLPPDANVAWEKIDGECKIIQYTSPTFSAAFGDARYGPQVALFGDDLDAVADRLDAAVRQFADFSRTGKGGAVVALDTLSA